MIRSLYSKSLYFRRAHYGTGTRLDFHRTITSPSCKKFKEICSLPLLSLFVAYKKIQKVRVYSILRLQSLCQELKQLSLRTRTLYSTGSHRSPGEPCLANMWWDGASQNIQKLHWLQVWWRVAIVVAQWWHHFLIRCVREAKKWEVRHVKYSAAAVSSLARSGETSKMMQKGHFCSWNRWPDCLESTTLT